MPEDRTRLYALYHDLEANGFFVTRSHAAPTLIALTALMALALCAALAVHLLGKEARS